MDALDLVAVHDQLVLLADLHVVLEATVHRVIPGRVSLAAKLAPASQLNRGFRKLGYPKWMVYSGKSYKDG